MAKSSLLTPDDHALLLIDHQYLQLLALRSHTSEAIVNNTTFLAKAARLFKVPTLLTTAQGFHRRHLCSPAIPYEATSTSPRRLCLGIAALVA